MLNARMHPYQVIWIVTCGLALYVLVCISSFGPTARSRYRAFSAYLIAYVACSAVLIWFRPETRIYDYVWAGSSIVAGIAASWATAEVIARIRSYYPYDKLLTWYAAVALVVSACFAGVLMSIPAWHTIDWSRGGIFVQLVATGQQALSLGLAFSMLAVCGIARIWPARQAPNVCAHVILFSAWQLAWAVALLIVNVHRTEQNWALATYIEQAICLACMVGWCWILKPDREQRPGALLAQIDEDAAWSVVMGYSSKLSALTRFAARLSARSLFRAER